MREAGVAFVGDDIDASGAIALALGACSTRYADARGSVWSDRSPAGDRGRDQSAAASTDADVLAATVARGDIPLLLAKNAPLNAVAHELSVLTYNVLAPLYVRPLDARHGEESNNTPPWLAEPAAERLDWAARQPRLSTELRSCAADVLMLQEVQFEKADDGTLELPQWLQEVARASGYEARIPPQRDLREIASRNERVLGTFCAVGNALLWRPSRLEAATAAGGKDATTRVGLALRGRRDGPLAPLGPTAFFSVHLDAKSEAQRVGQLEKCLEAARSFGTREVVIAGDLNTEALRGSAVGTLLGVGDCRRPTIRRASARARAAARRRRAERRRGRGRGGRRRRWRRRRRQWRPDGGADGVVVRAAPHRRDGAGDVAHCARARAVGRDAREPLSPARRRDRAARGVWTTFSSSRTLTPSARWATLEALPDDARRQPTVACPLKRPPAARRAFEIAPAPALDAAGRGPANRELGGARGGAGGPCGRGRRSRRRRRRRLEAAVVAAGGFEARWRRRPRKKNKKKGGTAAAMIEFLRGKREPERAQRRRIAEHLARGCVVLVDACSSCSRRSA